MVILLKRGTKQHKQNKHKGHLLLQRLTKMVRSRTNPKVPDLFHFYEFEIAACLSNLNIYKATLAVWCFFWNGNILNI